jgi:hypothetical protein
VQVRLPFTGAADELGGINLHRAPRAARIVNTTRALSRGDRMGGVCKALIAMLSLLTVVLSGCHSSDTSGDALGDWVKKECAIVADFKDRLGHLTRDFATNAKDQTALADTVQKMADLYDEVMKKDDGLGDPPNGEGTGDGDELEKATRSLIDELHGVASDFRSAKSNADIQAAISRMNNAIAKSMTTAAEWKKNHPTPEIDRLEKAYPGCSDEPE